MFPIIYDSTYVSIQTFWVFVVLSLLVSSHLSLKRLKRERVDFNILIKYSSGFLFWAFIFSRLTFFVLNPEIYVPGFDLRTLINFISIWDQGFSFWGGFIGFAGTLAYRLKRSEENIWKWFDAMLSPILIGIAVANFGQFLGGYGYGKPTGLPWGVSYELYNVKYTVPVHPTQIYSILIIVAILTAKNLIQKRNDFFTREGNSAIFLTTFSSLGFFLLEFLMGDDTFTLLNFRINSYLFLLIFLVSGYALIRRYHEPIKTTGPELPV